MPDPAKILNVHLVIVQYGKRYLSALWYCFFAFSPDAETGGGTCTRLERPGRYVSLSRVSVCRVVRGSLLRSLILSGEGIS